MLKIVIVAVLLVAELKMFARALYCYETIYDKKDKFIHIDLRQCDTDFTEFSQELYKFYGIDFKNDSIKQNFESDRKPIDATFEAPTRDIFDFNKGGGKYQCVIIDFENTGRKIKYAGCVPGDVTQCLPLNSLLSSQYKTNCRLCDADLCNSPDRGVSQFKEMNYLIVFMGFGLLRLLQF